MAEKTRLYIVTSPHARVGKTLLARLLIEFFRHSERLVAGYDLNPREPVLAGHFPELVWPLDIADTRGQMALFDRLIERNAITRVIDLGYDSYEQFFAVINEIGFVPEARRRSIEPVVLFIADRAPATPRAYAELRRCLPSTMVVPVHNEAVSGSFEREDFPPSRPECRMVRIPRLSPIVRGVIDRPSFSFGSHLMDQRGGRSEIHDWIDSIFAEFREFELRLLMGRLSSVLAGTLSKGPRPRRKPPA
jgi:hypothetical protein